MNGQSSVELRHDALQIWHAGVEAVRSQRLVRQSLRVDGADLLIGGEPCGTARLQTGTVGWADRSEPHHVEIPVGLAALGPPYELRLPLGSIRRIVVVGAGKAGAGMAEAVEELLGPKLMEEKQVVGWVNVPADCVPSIGPACRRPLNDDADAAPPNVRRVHLHAARPAGINEPTPEGVVGAEEILRLVGSLGPDDLCLCLISGGGSALMPAPVEGITLADKLAVTRHLTAAGANIEQLNTVRKQLSRIKGGELLRACRAGRLVSLIISDVLGDPLDSIASGPTVPDRSTPQAAMEVLEQFHAEEAGIAPGVLNYLRNCVCGGDRFDNNRGATAVRADAIEVSNFVIGNNATAVAAAAEEARRLGYSVSATSATHSEGAAEDIGRSLAETALEMRAGPSGADIPVCLDESAKQDRQECLPHRRCFISGGEPVVKLVEPSRRGLGGRNQQLVLAALMRLAGDGAEGIALLSGGTDGEDGPTDVAGAFLDADVLAATRRKHIEPADYLARNDAYQFFAPLDALIKTGPTQTNVCDLRVVVADSRRKAGTTGRDPRDDKR